ncbi:MAG: Fpg/Nei family DNA glycosylase [Peptococcaceae bacterium]|nr:Fpg/Nei family DNA glycosylase [Peptococcaceae bacterium]
MAELPEIFKISRQMDRELAGKKIFGLTLLQEKNLNILPQDFISRCVGASIAKVSYKGKWFKMDLDNHLSILVSLGMGGDILFYEDLNIKEKYQIKMDFTDGSSFSIKFWWFGRFLLFTQKELAEDSSISDLGVDPFNEEFTYEYFRGLFAGKNTQIKNFLMDQKNISGIGNMYMHDILFSARLHPKKKISDMKEDDFKLLYQSILSILRFSQSKGGSFYEKDFYGNPGDYGSEDFLVGYKENTLCPRCSIVIEKIKTGSTAAYICPNCQKI